MSKLLKGAIVGLGLLATVPVAEAMPALPNLAAPVTAGVPQIEKTVIVIGRPVVRRRVVVRRPRVIVRRPLVRRPAVIIR